MLSRLLAKDNPRKETPAKPAVGGKRKLHPFVVVEKSHSDKRDKLTKKRKVTNSKAGSVHESDREHWQRHSPEPESKNCGRCNFIREMGEFGREYPWLEPRPVFLGGGLEVWL